jgi:hypothetical protein
VKVKSQKKYGDILRRLTNYLTPPFAESVANPQPTTTTTFKKQQL